MILLAQAVVAMTAPYLLGLGLALLVVPERAAAFLSTFASTARAHYTELALRSIVGAGFILAAPTTRYPTVFLGFGWILVATTAGLLLIPWRWHHRFAQWAVPWALRWRRSYAVGSLILGGLVLHAAW